MKEEVETPIEYDTDVAANTEDVSEESKEDLKDDILDMSLKVECLKRGLASWGTKEKLVRRLIPCYVHETRKRKLMKPPQLEKRLKMEVKPTKTTTLA